MTTDDFRKDEENLPEDSDTRRVWHDDDLTTSYASYEGRKIFSQEAKEDYTSSDDVRKIVREEIKRNSKPKRSWIRGLALILVGSILGSLFTQNFLTPKGSIVSEGGATPQQAQSVTITPNENMNVESAVALKATPSVVGITTLVERKDNYFYYGNSKYAEGVGSGVVVSGDGYILTNSHVVSDGAALNIDVMFSDNTTAEATLLWNDASIDLAIIKVEKRGLTPAELGDSDKISVGDKSIAIGNPLGLDLKSTLTSGYISGLDRTITLGTGLSMEGLIQTDAAINSGNSGGALLDAQGRLIGINTAKTNYTDGIGFAIPINTAKPIIDKVIATGSFESVFLGIGGIDLEVYAQYTGNEYPVDNGVYVTEVQNNTAARLAGIEIGDIITSVGGKPVGTMSELKKQLLLFSVGDSTQITILRKNSEREMDITFSEKSNTQ